jgi:hypothetical protein
VGAQVAGCLDQAEVKFLRRGVNGQYGKRQKRIDHDQQHRLGIIEQ